MALDTIISSVEQLPRYSGFALLIALVGFWDDFVSRSSPIARLAFVLAIAAAALVTNAVPMNVVAYDWLPFGLQNSLALTLAGVLVITGFVNAGNMADGANGLLSIVGVSFFSALLTHGGAGFASFFIMALLVFLVFNVTTGRMFLGDFGAYGLSAMIAFGSLELYSTGTVSLWFLGSLLAYPCLEIVRVIVVRSLKGVSSFKASNDHLHNYLYELLRNRGWNRIVANSTTGCLLGTVSAVLPTSLVLSGLVEIDRTNFWCLYFGGYSITHLGLVIWFNRLLQVK